MSDDKSLADIEGSRPMERLHIAVERARAERLAKEARGREPSEETVPETGTAASAPPPPPAAPATAGPGEAEDAPAHPDQPDANAIKAAWAALTPLQMSKKKRRTRTNPALDSAYRALRTRMLQQMRRNDWRRVAIVSPDPGDGKTSVAAHVGQGMSRQFDTRTVVLDLDLRRIGLSKLLRPENLRSNMGAVLSGDRSFLKHALRVDSNVAFGLNEDPVEDASDLLQSRATELALDRIDRELEPEMIVVDMPPLLLQEDNVAFLENVDCALIVVAAESTPMSRIDAAERQVAELTSVMGIVLNKCRYPDRSDAYAYAS